MPYIPAACYCDECGKDMVRQKEYKPWQGLCCTECMLRLKGPNPEKGWMHRTMAVATKEVSLWHPSKQKGMRDEIRRMY